MNTTWRVLLSTMVLTAATGCGQGLAGEAVRPEAKSGAQARGEGAASFDCSQVAPAAQPLVVDWPDHDRMDLGITLRQEGVAVVHYACDGIRLLKHCALEGDYQFAGAPMMLDVVTLETADSVAASLPVQGATLAAEVSGDARIDVATAIIGRINTLVRGPTPAELKGDCADATHYVRSAYVGAFSMATGTKGSAEVAVEVFEAGAGGSSSSARTALTRDGDLEACESYQLGQPQPPGQCQSAVRVELFPLAEASGVAVTSESDDEELTNVCAAGYVYSDGKCTRPEQVAAYRCDRDDHEDCKAQCAAGNIDSCHNAGLGPRSRRPVAPNDPKYAKSRAETRPLFEQACEGGVAAACAQLGMDYGSKNTGVYDPKKAAEYYRRACFDLMYGTACIFLSTDYAKGKGVRRDPRMAVDLLERGCNLGSGSACQRLAGWYIEGNRELALKRDTAKGASILERACTQAKMGYACLELAEYHAQGKFMRKNPAVAKRFHDKGCALKPDAYACKRKAPGARRGA